MLSTWRLSLIQFITRNDYRKEIAVVILLKLAALFLLWSLFFSHSDPTQLEKPNLVNHFVSQ